MRLPKNKSYEDAFLEAYLKKWFDDGVDIYDMKQFPPDINQRVEGRATPLFDAAYNANLLLVKQLLRYGADPNIPSYVECFKRNANTMMIEDGMPYLVLDLFLRYRTWKQRDSKVFVNWDYGVTNLHYPVYNGENDIVHELLEAGANPNARCFNGLFPLHAAAEFGYVAIIEDLLAHGAEVDQETPLGCTALQNAAEEGNAQAVQCLLRAGADVTHRSANGETPIDAALRCGQYAIANQLKFYVG